MSSLEFRPLLAVLHAAVIVAAALVASRWVLARSRLAARLLTPQAGRAGSLDGLRGLLALGVLVHHSFTAYVYFTTGRWGWSGSAFLNQCGQSTVALFFMITAFLFSDKLLRSAQGRPVDWRQLYASRVRRLTPIYLLAVAVVVLSVGALSGWQLREPPGKVLSELIDWALFVIPGRPDINALPMTWTIMAGVNWSLQYEWFFYAALPLLFWPLRLLTRTTLARVAIALLCAVLAKSIWSGHNIGPPRLFCVHFACGVATALVRRDDVLSRLVASLWFRAIALACVVALCTRLSADGGLAVLLTWTIFLAVSGGASLFGALKTRPAIWLGEVSYGIYLMHGIVLYWTLYWLRGAGLLPDLGVAAFAAGIAGVAMGVVALASASYVFLEKPLMTARRRPAARPAIGVVPGD